MGETVIRFFSLLACHDCLIADSKHWSFFFCSLSTETVTHLFLLCPIVQNLWIDVCNFIINNIVEEFKLFWRDVLFGLFDSDRIKGKPNETFIINLFILLAKFHIHKSKFSHSKPLFLIFENETKQYIKSISDSNNKKAIKTIDLCSFFDIFM